LERVHKCWTVYLVKDVLANLDDVVGPNPQNGAVEGLVMYRAHGHAVRNDRFAALGVLTNVRRFQELSVTQMAESALVPIGFEHPLAKHRLVDSPLNE
jgi:hypothetical protein